LSIEWSDLKKVGFNNATNAFWQTGLFPFNPYTEAWTDAIETIGQAQPISGAAHYKVFPNMDLPQLPESESNTLHNGLKLDNLQLHDVVVACIWSMHTLGWWRDDIQTAVNEGEDYVQYSNKLLHSAKNDAKKIAMQLIHFQKIEKACLPPVTLQKSKEEIAHEITHQIVCSTKITEPLKVSYLSKSNNDSTELASNTFSSIAVKMDMNMWHMYLQNKTCTTATDKDLMDKNKYFVQCKWMNLDSNVIAKKKQSAKQKHVWKAEKSEQPKRICEQGLQKQQELKQAEYNKLCEIFKSGQPYQFEQFLEMANLLQKPFVCKIEGHEVSLTQEDCTIMMEWLAIWAITESLFSGKEKQKCENMTGNQK